MNVLKIEGCVQRKKVIQISKTFGTSGSILQGISEEVKKQAEQRINSRFIMYVSGVHNKALKNNQRRRLLGKSAESQKLKKAKISCVP